jgi:HAMP domain-containing protein
MPDVSSGSIDVPVKAPSDKRRLHLGMRWKLLFGFGLGITVVFIFVAAWILSFSTNTATSRVKDTLRALAVGGADTINPTNFSALLQVPAKPTPGSVYPANAGYLAGQAATADSTWPTDASFWNHVQEMRDIRLTNPDASPYTFAVTSDGTLRFIGQWGAYGYTHVSWCTDKSGKYTDQPCGAGFKQAASEIYGTVPHYVTDGLVRTTEQPAYKDSLNTWISVYTPIKDHAGKIIGGLGVDYPLSYVNKVRSRVLRVLYPVFGIAYVVLLALIVFLSGFVTRRLTRLTAVTQKVAEGDYSVDVEDSARALFADEMTELANSFHLMTQKVGDRERTLTRTVAVLRVEIDEAKRRDAVSEIVDSDFFDDLTRKAVLMRAKVKGLELAETAAGKSDDGGTSQ